MQELIYIMQRHPTILTTAAILTLIAISAKAVAANDESTGDAALFNRLDANDDGLVDANEVSDDHMRLFFRLLDKADTNDDGALSQSEFLAGLVPSRPKKQIETKQPAALPAADAVRYLLLTLDVDANRAIESSEVTEDMRSVFVALADRLDRNENGALEPNELSRGGRPLAEIASRYVASRQVDVSAELKRLEESQGNSADRFDGRRPAIEAFAEPKQARALFSRLDADRDGQVEMAEVPEPFQPQFERLLRVADSDDDGRLSEQEFLSGAKQISRFLRRSR